MRTFIRARVPGASYFFTVTLRDRRAATLVDHIDTLRACLARAKAQRPFRIDAMVVLPEHLHALWTLPPDDSDYAMRWRLIKRSFTRALGAPAWQARYWEHLIRSDTDFARHVDYIHFNPVKHGWVSKASDWPYSSFHRYVRAGMLPADWGIAAGFDGEFGE